jgi:N-acetylmuramoyl-L-alanine amidase
MRSNSWRAPRWIAIHLRAGCACLLFVALGLISAQTTPAPSASQTAPQGPAAPIQTLPTQPQIPDHPISSPPKPLIMIDPAHGGSESGAVLSPTILEKDVTLELARRLRVDLGSHGFIAELVRDSDANLSADDRAAKVNSVHPVLYVCLHATSEAGRLGIYTALLNETAESRGPFIDWNTAQFTFLPASRSAQQEIVAVMQKSGIPARALVAPLQPLNNVTGPAVAIEVAPTKADVSQLVSGDFQQSVSTALANGIAQAVSAQVNSGASR